MKRSVQSISTFHFSKEYWKKYTDRNDINAYIRIFSQFDFTLFNQIKQLLPARVDDAMGLLIEPHALERVKVPITKRPAVENPQWDVVFTQPQPTASAEYTLYSASISPVANLLHVESVYHTGSNGYNDVGNTWFANINVGPTSGSMDYCIIEINPVDALPSYTASYSNLTQYTDPLIVGFDQDPFISASINVLIDDSDSTYIEWFEPLQFAYTQELQVKLESSQFDTHRNIKVHLRDYDGFDQDADIEVIVRVFTYNDNGTINVLSTNQAYSIINIAIDDREILLNNVSIPAYKDFYIGIRARLLSTNNISYRITKLSVIQSILEVCHSATLPIVDKYRTSNIYKQVVYHYSGSNVNESLRDRNAYHAYSQSLGLYYSQSLIDAPYFDDFFDQIENVTYAGSRLVGPGVNVSSNIAAIGNTPVIEVFETNPNQLIFTQTPESRGTTGTTEPGNLIVR